LTAEVTLQVSVGDIFAALFALVVQVAAVLPHIRLAFEAFAAQLTLDVAAASPYIFVIFVCGVHFEVAL
jgi:hypothetical protein